MEFKRNNGLEHSDVLCSVLIESDWNLKTGIQERCEQDCKGINRIRLEFKRSSKRSLQRRTGVLIESDWNLKEVIGAGVAVQDAVLIESDWNLKEDQ